MWNIIETGMRGAFPVEARNSLFGMMGAIYPMIDATEQITIESNVRVTITGTTYSDKALATLTDAGKKGNITEQPHSYVIYTDHLDKDTIAELCNKRINNKPCIIYNTDTVPSPLYIYKVNDGKRDLPTIYFDASNVTQEALKNAIDIHVKGGSAPVEFNGKAEKPREIYKEIGEVPETVSFENGLCKITGDSNLVYRGFLEAIDESLDESGLGDGCVGESDVSDDSDCW